MFTLNQVSTIVDQNYDIEKDLVMAIVVLRLESIALIEVRMNHYVLSQSIGSTRNSLWSSKYAVRHSVISKIVTLMR